MPHKLSQLFTSLFRNESLLFHLFCKLETLALLRTYGDEEARTPDLRRAKAALSHLSYIPFHL